MYVTAAMRQPAEEQEERRAQRNGPEHHRVRLRERELQVRRHEEVRLELALVPDHSLASGEAEQDEEDRADLAAAEALLGPVAGAGHGLLLLLEAREQRRLAQADADVERDDEQQRAEDERVPPADAREVCRSHRRAEVQDDREREEE